MTALELLAKRAQMARSAAVDLTDVRDVRDVISPCVSVCRMSPSTALCEGCFRTIAEIADWSRMDGAGKAAVWQRIERRAGIVCV